MPIPTSTYRIQLHKGFSFRDLQRILDYLHTLGVGTVYASPIMQATPGSMHGYDVTDPHEINAELGTAEDLRSIIRDLRKKDMFWLQDIVPNHMAFHTMNHRLMDVLERGPASPYYNYFDIDWSHPDEDLTGKVMVPFLGNELADCLREGQIKLSLSADGLKVKYFDTSYPLSIPAYSFLISLLTKNEEDNSVAAMLSKITTSSEGSDLRTWDTTKMGYVQAIMQEPEYYEAVQRLLAGINQDPGLLNSILNQQYYRLTFWKETDKRINYRRFFTINELICLRMEDDSVFDEYHTYLFKLYKDKLLDGFRIDHIDGLQDPAGYTQELRAALGDSCYIIAEKILEAKEDMPAHWPLQGTSGYEFLSLLNQLLTNRKGARQLLDYYRELVPDMPPYQKLISDSKKLILENYISGEWSNLTHLFRELGLAGSYEDDRLKAALGMFMLSLPVYRIYPDNLPLKGKTLLTIHEAFDKAMRTGSEYSDELSYLRGLLTNVPVDETQSANILAFLKRVMQFTGPLTAKGVEDTTFYIYNPLISHDEVGDSPAPLGMRVQRFHEKMANRQQATPLSLNASATHDTKRGEDARVRINVLSRMPEIWKENVANWFAMNSVFRTQAEGRTVPHINDEYFIYQSMLGGFPEDFQVTEEWIKRVQTYLNKALREAKVNTNWSEPDEEYEQACERFIERILHPEHSFVASFIPFVKTVCEHAMVYSLTQTLIKLTAPGIPDVYQGCELWDLSFVDPDNRRPVDYDKRMEFLFQLVVREEKGSRAVFDYLRDHREEGVEKLYITWKILNLRRKNPDVFTEGQYIPLAITGKDTRAAAYARRHNEYWVLVIFPFGLVRHDRDVDDDGNDQFLVLPEDAPESWSNLFTQEAIQGPNQISIRDLFGTFPVALLVAENRIPS